MAIAALPLIGAGAGRVGIGNALGGMAKDAAIGAGRGFLGGLKGAMISEAPGLTGAYALGQELRRRANAPKPSSNSPLSSGGSSSQSSNSSMMGAGLSSGISAAAGQQKRSNVIDLEQVRQLRILNNTVANQSKLLASQINEAKRKDAFAEETANEQTLRDDKLLAAIEKMGGGGSGPGGMGGSGGGGDGGGFFKSLAKGLLVAAGGLGLLATKAFGAGDKKPPPTPAQTKIEYDNLVKRQAALQAAAEKEYKPPGPKLGNQTGGGQSEKYQQIMVEKRRVDAQVKRMKPSVVNRDGTAKVVTESNYLDNLARAESADKKNPDGNPNATNPTPGQTASGLYQFTKGTWKDTVEKMVNKGLISREDFADQKNRFDPAKSKLVAEYFTEQNALGLRKNLGRDPTQADLYMAHFLGLGGNNSGAIRFLQAFQQNPNALAIDFVGPEQSAANQAIFYTKDVPPKPRTLAEVYAIMSKKIGGGPAPATGNKNTVPSTGNTPVVPNVKTGGFKKNFEVKGYRPGNQLDIKGVSSIEDHYKGLTLTPQGTSSIAVASAQTRSIGGGGTVIKDDKPIAVHDKKSFDQTAKVAKAQGINSSSGAVLRSTASTYGTALNTQSFRPLFRSNSDIIAQTNRTFLQQFRRSATTAFTQAITKGLFPKGFGVAFSRASQDDTFRGQQLQKIFGTTAVVNNATTKLLGKQYGPMFAPLFNNLAQGYLEVGSRIAGKAIFQGIGGLGARETQGITGQILGNFAAGNKKLAFEQLLFGASGGKESGIALGPETLFAKYGFANPAEGISFFANALGERATQPFSKLMGADDRSKSILFDPRTKQHVYADSGAPASQADIRAAGVGFGSRVSQTSMFGPAMDNFGMPGAPYQTTAGVRGTYRMNNSASAFDQILNAPRGQDLSRAQAFGLTDAQQSAGGVRLIAEQNTMIRAQGELQNKQLEQQAKLAEEAAKRQFDIAAAQAATEAEMASAQAVYDKALNEAKTSTDRVDTDRVIAKLDQVGGKPAGGGTVVLDKDGNPVTRNNKRPGQLFDSNVYDKAGKVVGQDPMKEIGNFGFDMFKNMAGQKLTQDIKNPYAQMVANFAIQKGLNVVTDKFVSPLLEKGGNFLLEKGGSFIMDTVLPFFGFAEGGVVTKATPGVFGEAGAEAIIPLANPNATKALSAAMGTDKTLSSLGDQTDLLTSIDGSLRMMTGRGSASGTGLSFDTGLSGVFGSGGGSSFSGGGGGTVINGVARSRATQQKPSTMDYVTAIGGSMLKSFAINKGIGMASTAIFGATPSVLAGNALIAAGFPTLGAALGGTTIAAGTGLTAGAAGVTGLTAGAAGATGLTAGSAAIGGSLGTSAAAVSTGVGTTAAGTTAAAAGGSTAMASLAAAAPYVLAAVAVYFIAKSIYGGKSRPPPPKEPKYHAVMYVTGNNNIDAISPAYETQEYHAVPDVFKTIAFGLLRVAFNATKSSEAVTKITSSYDFIYMKVQFNKISMIVGKGAPNIASLQSDSATEVLSWDAPSESTNLNTLSRDIIVWVKEDFKKLAKTEDLAKLDKAASALGSYSLDEISRGLIPDLVKGKYALDQKVEKGIFANSVAESRRIEGLISAANSKRAYMTEGTAAQYDPDTGAETVAAVEGGVPMVYSLKDGKFIENKFPGALLVDTAGRPVYDIEGTSAGLSVDDFVSSTVAGGSRPANVLADTATSGAGGSSGTTNNVTTVTGPKVDNSAVTNYYNSLSSVVDPIRGTSSNVA